MRRIGADNHVPILIGLVLDRVDPRGDAHVASLFHRSGHGVAFDRRRVVHHRVVRRQRLRQRDDVAEVLTGRRHDGGLRCLAIDAAEPCLDLIGRTRRRQRIERRDRDVHLGFGLDEAGVGSREIGERQARRWEMRRPECAAAQDERGGQQETKTFRDQMHGGRQSSAPDAADPHTDGAAVGRTSAAARGIGPMRVTPVWL
jgi:hypothetical protein